MIPQQMNLPMQDEHGGLITTPDPHFYTNLVDMVGAQDLEVAAGKLYDLVEFDEKSRERWVKCCEEAEKFENDFKASVRTNAAAADSSLGEIKHSSTAIAASNFVAQTTDIINPKEGPVKAMVVGQETEELEAQCKRVQAYMNWQFKRGMPGYNEETDKMLFQIAYLGQAFRKVYKDDMLGEICAKFIPAKNLLVNNDANSIKDAVRITWKTACTLNDYNKYVEQGYYAPLKKLPEMAGSYDPTSRENITIAKAHGKFPSSTNNDGYVELWEMHVSYGFPGVDGFTSGNGEANGPERDVMLPYIITMEPQSRQIVSVRRNWRETDQRMKRRDWFVSYQFEPSSSGGFYGEGIWQKLGGTAKAVSAIMQELTMAGALANKTTGFKMKDGTQGKNIQVEMGKFTEIGQASLGPNSDIRKLVMPMDFKPPSPALFELMQYMDQEVIQKFAQVHSVDMKEAGSQAAYGTVALMLESQGKVFSAIQKRLLHSMENEIRLVAELNSLYLPPHFQFHMEGEASVIFQQDFSSRIDVRVSADPNNMSKIQKWVRSIELNKLREQFPGMVNDEEILEYNLEAMGIEGHERFLNMQEPPPPTNPLTENSMLINGMPIQAYPEQDHRAHIKIMIDFISDPSIQAHPNFQEILMRAIAHLNEHTGFLYLQLAAQQLNIPLEMLQSPDMPPDIEAQLSAEAAVLTMNDPIMLEVKAMEQLTLSPEAIAARQISESKIELDRAAAQSKIESDIKETNADIYNEEQKKARELQHMKAINEEQERHERVMNEIREKKEKEQPKKRGWFGK